MSSGTAQAVKGRRWWMCGGALFLHVNHRGHAHPLVLTVLQEGPAVEILRRAHALTPKLVEESLWADAIVAADPLALEVFEEQLAIEIGRHTSSPVPELVKEPLGIEGISSHRTGRHTTAGQ